MQCLTSGNQDPSPANPVLILEKGDTHYCQCSCSCPSEWDSCRWTNACACAGPPASSARRYLLWSAGSSFLPPPESFLIRQFIPYTRYSTVSYRTLKLDLSRRICLQGGSLVFKWTSISDLLHGSELQRWGVQYSSSSHSFQQKTTFVIVV